MPRQLTLLQPERRANHSASKGCAKVLTTIEAASLYGSAKSFAAFVLNGSSGKTYPMFCGSTEHGPLVPFSGAWGNAGMGPPTEFLTLNISEAPSDGAECLLSDIVETGAVPPQCYLTDHNRKRMASRLRKYGDESSELLIALESSWAGLATKHRSSPLNASPRFGRSKAAKE